MVAAAKLGLVFCRRKSMCMNHPSAIPHLFISANGKNVAAATIYFYVLVMMPLEVGTDILLLTKCCSKEWI